jgi:hypothetical protein
MRKSGVRLDHLAFLEESGHSENGRGNVLLFIYA